MEKLNQLEKKIGLFFKNKRLLKNIFIHRSYLNEHKDFPLPSNEKLEFLGDSVLSLVTSLYLFKKYPKLNEGDYTDIKAAIVRTESLAQAAKKLNLGKYLYLSKGEELSGGRDNISILADCFEALIGALFLDSGFRKTYHFINQNLFKNKLSEIINKKLYLSPKSRLQEIIQGKYKKLPRYKIVKEDGPAHQRSFTTVVYILGKKVASGTGRSRKQSEEEAAKKALEKLGYRVL